MDFFKIPLNQQFALPQSSVRFKKHVWPPLKPAGYLSIHKIAQNFKANDYKFQFKGSCSPGGGGSKEDMVCNKNRFLTTLLAAPHLSNHSFNIREKYGDLGVFQSFVAGPTVTCVSLRITTSLTFPSKQRFQENMRFSCQLNLLN